MKAQAYNVFIPLEIGDRIKGDVYPDIYIISDIKHTYSAKEQTVTDVTLELVDAEYGTVLELPFDYCNWEVIKDD